jgi:hypothetical protein
VIVPTPATEVKEESKEERKARRRAEELVRCSPLQNLVNELIDRQKN